MPKQCDNKSVGVIITNTEGEIALLRRALFPIAIAPPAGHIDDHGSREQAAIDEVQEEIGLVVAAGALKTTAIHDRRINNVCRRPGGDHHAWWVYEVSEFNGDIDSDPTETQGAGWYSMGELQALADRTRKYLAGEINKDGWDEEPGLERTWLDFLVELGYVE